MKTVIITGVSGQDGSYLAKFLLNKGYKVIGIVRNDYVTKIKNLAYLGIERDIIIEKINLLDINDLIKVFKKYKPDEIYNLAAQSSVGLSFQEPLKTFSFNTLSVNNLIDTIRDVSPNTKLYQASSSEMYGQVKKTPITLETPMLPVSPYGVSKMASFFMVTTYRYAYNLFMCNGVLFNHESFLRGNNYFVKKIVRDSIAIKNGKLKKLIVGNLNVKRDFGYAPKYVEAMWKMLQMEKADDFIICSGKAVLLLEIVEFVFNKLNIDKNLIIQDKNLFRPNEIKEIYGDNTKAREILNWNYDFPFFDILDILIEDEIKGFKNL